MTDATLLFLPAGDDLWHWLRLRGDHVAERGEGWPVLDDAPVVAVAPADAVTLHWAALPDRSTAQAMAAARILVAEASAASVGELHVAVGLPDGEDRPIAVVSNERMRGWLALLQANGVDPAALVPAPLLIPRPAEGYVRAELGGQHVVRGTSSGFADEARLTALVTGGTDLATLGRDDIEQAIAGAVAAPALDLRQGAFARRRRRSIDWPLVRRLAALGGLVLLATLAIDVVRIARYSFGADTMEARANTLARESLPRGTAMAGDADRLLDERLARVRGPGLGFTRSAAVVYAAVQAVPGTELTALDFQPNGDLRVSVAAQGEAEVNNLKGRIEQSGLRVEASVFQSNGGRLTGEMTVRRP